jgi:DNA-binding HxlR family transcriptional regulator
MESNNLNVCISSDRGNEMLKLLGSRGTMDILCIFCCQNPVVRFTQLSNMLGHVSTKTLASRLKELEKEEILRRTAYNEIPPRVEYTMTEKGLKLAEALMPLIQWVVDYSEGDANCATCKTSCPSEQTTV